MIEEILPNLYRMEIPIPNNPLRSLNSYLLKGQDRFLIIDTGMNREECLKEMLHSLDELNVDLKRTDFFITHIHVDHIGLVEKLVTKSSTVYFNQKEVPMFDLFFSNERWQRLCQFYYSSGFPGDELEEAIKTSGLQQYKPKQHLEFRVVRDGDSLQIGDYLFRCVETPGHSPGHMCLYEARKKILFSGDHILMDITPNIGFWFEMQNSLKEYLTSLEKVYNLDVNLVLPGHRERGKDHRKRIKELREHHQARLNEILAALEKAEMTAFEVAPYITWDIKYATWDEFPVAQKFFALGETAAHLHFLEQGGMIRRGTKDHTQVFRLTREKRGSGVWLDESL